VLTKPPRPPNHRPISFPPIYSFCFLGRLQFLSDEISISIGCLERSPDSAGSLESTSTAREELNNCWYGHQSKSDKIWQSGKSVKNVVHNTCVFLSILTNSNYGVSKKIRCKHRGGGGATSFQGMRIARRGAFGTRQQIPPGAAESRRSAGKKCSLDPTSTFPRDQDDSS